MARHGSHGSAGGCLPARSLISPGPAAPGRLRAAPSAPSIHSHPGPGGGSGAPQGSQGARSAAGGLEAALGPAPGLARPPKAAAPVPKDPRASPPPREHGRAGVGRAGSDRDRGASVGRDRGSWALASSQLQHFPGCAEPEARSEMPRPRAGHPSSAQEGCGASPAAPGGAGGRGQAGVAPRAGGSAWWEATGPRGGPRG